MATSKAVRAEIARNRMTQRETAQLAGIAYSAFVLKLAGRRDFSVTEIRRLSSIFGISFAELARRIERENPNEMPAAAATATGE